MYSNSQTATAFQFTRITVDGWLDNTFSSFKLQILLLFENNDSIICNNYYFMLYYLFVRDGERF